MNLNKACKGLRELVVEREILMSSLAVTADEMEREPHPDPKGSERCRGALQWLVDPAQEH